MNKENNKTKEKKKEKKLKEKNEKVKEGTFQVDEKMLEEVAEVARLELSPEEKKKLLPELKEVLKTFSKINQAKTEAVKPSFQPIEIESKMREDKEGECLSQEEALKNVKEKREGYILGPSIL